MQVLVIFGDALQKVPLFRLLSLQVRFASRRTSTCRQKRATSRRARSTKKENPVGSNLL